MKKFKFVFLLTLTFLFFSCEKDKDNPSSGATRLSEVIIDDTGEDYIRFKFVYNNEKLSKIEYWENDRYWSDGTDTWEKSEWEITFVWTGEQVAQIKWGTREEINLDYSTENQINVTYYYKGDSYTEEWNEKWIYSNDKLQSITRTSAYYTNEYKITWIDNEVSEVYETGDYGWKWKIQNGTFKSPYLEILPLSVRQIFLFHQCGFYDSDGILMWSNEYIPSQILEDDYDPSGDELNENITNNYLFESNDNGFLSKMSHEEVAFEYHYE